MNLEIYIIINKQMSFYRKKIILVHYVNFFDLLLNQLRESEKNPSRETHTFQTKRWSVVVVVVGVFIWRRHLDSFCTKKTSNTCHVNDLFRFWLKVLMNFLTEPLLRWLCPHLRGVILQLFICWTHRNSYSNISLFL